MSVKYVTDCEFCEKQEVGVTRDYNLSTDRRDAAPWRVSRHFVDGKVCKAGTRIAIPAAKVRRKAAK